MLDFFTMGETLTKKCLNFQACQRSGPLNETNGISLIYFRNEVPNRSYFLCYTTDELFMNSFSRLTYLFFSLIAPEASTSNFKRAWISLLSDFQNNIIKPKIHVDLN